MKPWQLLVLLLPLVQCLKRPDDVALALAPSRTLPQKFQELKEKRMNAGAVEYLRCDPAVPEYNLDRCHPFKEELHFTGRPLKLVMGVMAMQQQHAIHEAHRQTWMKLPGVCPLQRYQDPRCQVFPVFVFGDADVSGADVVSLRRVPEPPQIWDGFQDTKNTEGWKRSWWTSQFKTPAWLDYASKNFRWATHVGKMDSDTFPDMVSIMEDLSKKPVTKTGHEWPIFYGRHFKGGYNGKGGMFGEFYALSFSLLDCFLRADGRRAVRSDVIHGRNTTWSKEWWDYAEDQVLRTTLFHAEEEGLCPQMLDVHAVRWQHPV